MMPIPLPSVRSVGLVLVSLVVAALVVKALSYVFPSVSEMVAKIPGLSLLAA